MPWSVRDAVAADAHGIAKVHVTTWQVSYKGLIPQSRLDSLSVARRAERWSGMLAARPTSGQWILVAETGGGEIVGFASGGPPGAANDGDPAYDAAISSVYVLPSYQGKGIGTRLLREVAGRWPAAAPARRSSGA